MNYSIEAEPEEVETTKIPIITNATVTRRTSSKEENKTFGWNEAIQELYGLKED